MKKSDLKDMGLSLKQLIRDVWAAITGSLKPVLLFSALYSVVSALVVDAVMKIALDVGLRAAGTSYFGQDNLASVLLRPSSVIVILVTSVILTNVSLFEIAGIMYAFSTGRDGKSVTLGGMYRAGVSACLKTLKPQNWPCILFVLVLMPLTGVLSLSGNSLYTAVPDFVMAYIFSTPVYLAAFAVAFTALILIEYRYIFSLPYYIIGDYSFPAACGESKKLIQRSNLYLLLSFLAVLFLEYALFMGVSSVAANVILNPPGFLSGANFSNYELERMAEYIYEIYSFMTAVLAPAINLALLTVLFYTLLNRKKLTQAAVCERKENRKAFRFFTAIIVLLICYAVCCNRSNIGMLWEEVQRPQIAAHRGESVKAPENTIPAFELAIAEGADWIELDVHETKDGVIVVSHDDNLKRVSGKKQFVHDLTYAELQEIDTGSWFSSYYSSLRLATLDEVLKVCRGKIKLQIEIKPTKYDHEIEEKVLQVINDNGMHDDVVIISLSPEPLKRIKELDPTMATGYCMYLAWGIIEDIDFADYFTIELSNVDAAVVSDIHNAGKKCFVWTVNSEDDVQHLTDCGVDVIVTDDPVMMRKAVEGADCSPILRMIRLFVDRVTWGW